MRGIAIIVLVGCSSPSSTPESDAGVDAPAMVETCGNGQLDDGETCDGVNLDGYTCGALGLGVGTLACRVDCAGFDARNCAPEDPDDPPTCTPQTCASLGLTCGNAADGCGHTLACGTCTTPPDPVRWVDVAAGGEHTCALRDDGSVWCFGRNNFNQLGGGGTPFGFDARPVRVPTANDWRSVVVGKQHSCGLRVDGKAWCWGKGDSGQLGNGNLVTTATPVQYLEPQEYPYEQLAAGAYHTCALRQGGGQRTCAGATTLGFPAATPSYTGSFLDMTSSGGDVSCGVTSAAVLRCDVLGDDQTSNATKTWMTVDVGDDFWCGLAAGGTLHCQGDGIWGQLGNGANVSSATPVQAGASLGWASVSAGGRHACGITFDGTLYCWGANENGQLGDTTIQRRSAPTYIGTGYALVDAGENHTCAIRLDGSLWCFGKGAYGRLGTNGTTDATSPTRVVD